MASYSAKARTLGGRHSQPPSTLRVPVLPLELGGPVWQMQGGFFNKSTEQQGGGFGAWPSDSMGRASPPRAPILLSYPSLSARQSFLRTGTPQPEGPC